MTGLNINSFMMEAVIKLKQSIDLLCKLMDWFLYGNGLRYERVKENHTTLHCLNCMVEMWKKILDEEGCISAIFMELSKTFEKLNYYLLVAKLGIYGFEIDALRYIKSYLTYRKQMIDMNKILQVIVDNKSNFKSHINEFSKKASQKIAALSRLFSYQHNSENIFCFFNSTIKSQFIC